MQVYRARGQARYNGEDERIWEGRAEEEEEEEDGTRGEAEKRRVARPTREKREGLSRVRSMKCVGECELVSRESPLSVALGVPPSVILSVRPYFVAHAPYTCASASRQSQGRAFSPVKGIAASQGFPNSSTDTLHSDEFSGSGNSRRKEYRHSVPVSLRTGVVIVNVYNDTVR